MAIRERRIWGVVMADRKMPDVVVVSSKVQNPGNLRDLQQAQDMLQMLFAKGRQNIRPPED